MPAHMIINGIHAIIGIYLITVIVGVRSSRTVRNIPTSDPSIGIVGRIPVGISLYVVAKYHANIIKTGITKASVVFRAVFSFFIFHTS